MRRVPLKNIHHFKQYKQSQQKITMLTCYDYTSAQIANNSNIDCLLVGDSAAMVMHGFSSTVPANTTMITAHVAAVARGAGDKFIVGDMPFCSYRKGLTHTVEAAQTLMQAGASAIKLEGAAGNLDSITHLTDSGIPVMGHLGLTPQSIHTLGGFKVQGREQQQAERIMQQAQQLEQAGCFAVVLECIPQQIAQRITQTLQIPTIGIGAGPHTDGQVLVWQDLLGLNPNFNPKFVKKYLSGFELIKNALNQYDQHVKESQFPCVEQHSF